MKYFKKITGERVYLSPMNVEDANIFTKWMNDFKVTDGVGNSKVLITEELEKIWLEERTKQNTFNFSIIKLENDELMGNCGIMDIDNVNRVGTIGIFIGEEENRGKGFGLETINLLLEYGFKYLNLNNIMLKVMSFNQRAINSYKKAGFKEFGRRQSYFINGEYYDDIHMDILSSEFEGTYIKNKNI